MESFDLSDLKVGDTLLVRTESGSTYRLDAEVEPVPLDEAKILYKGFRATRESDHPI